MKLAIVSILCCVVAAKPGVPSLDWAENKYALVSVRPDATSYESLIERVSDNVSVVLKWNVWSGSSGSSADLLFDNAVVKRATEQELQQKQINHTVSRGGRYKAAVRLCDDNGECSVSSAVTVVVADTDGSHLSPLPIEWNENNVPYQRGGTVVAAYFVEWGVYGRQYPANKIPIPNLTHLLYGFVPICGGDGINDSLKQITNSFETLQKSCSNRADFSVSIHDIWGALQKPQKGVEAWNEPYKGNFGQLMAIKRHNPHLTILPSIGGWTLSDPFFFMHDPAKRAVFVESVREFLQTWKFFDGVDLDWEFPGGKGANPALGDPAVDGKTYVALLRELRFMLDELAEQNNRDYQLTIAISAGHDKIQVVNYDAVQKYLNHIFVMTYDFRGAWSNTDVGHQTPLYGNDQLNAHHAITEMLKQNVDSKKLVLGVAMYGRGWTGVQQPSGPATGPVAGTWENGVVDYRDILRRYNTSSYDDAADAAYVFSNSDYVSYDSVRSVLAKGAYVLEHKLGGLFAWEIDADNGDLLNAMNQGLGNKKVSLCKLDANKYAKYLCTLKPAILYGLDMYCK